MKGDDGKQAFAYPAWIVGIVLALAVAGAYGLGLPLLVELEGRVSDFLFASARIRPPEPSPRIVHLDIDDNSLDTVGRWPWPRARIAEAVAAIDRLGARVIALDLLLIDRQDPKNTPGGMDHDRLLADTLAACEARTVLAVKVDEAADLLGDLWTSEEGRAQWQAMMDLLRHDINLPAELVVKKLDLTGERAARVRERIHGIKRIVVRDVAEELRADGRLTVPAMREVLLPPDKNEMLRRFPELPTIENAVAFERAAAAVEEKLPDKARGTSYPRIGNVLTPLPAFAEVVDLVGVVNATQDGDGQLRRVQLRWQRDRKIYPQFGAAAAFAFLGRPMEELARPALELTPGESIRSDVMLLSWPRIRPDRPILGLAEHVSLGRVIDMLRVERELAEQEQKRDKLSREFIRVWFAADGWKPEDLDDPDRRIEIEMALAKEIDYMLDGDDPSDSDPSRETLAAREWQHYTIEIDRARLAQRRAWAELRAAIHDKLVFIGWNATGNFGDFFPTAAHERTPGVVAHAIVANAFLAGYLVQESPAWVGALVTALLGIVASFVTVRADPRLGFLLALLIATVFVAGNVIVVFGAWRVFAATATPLIGLTVGWAGTLLVRAVRERREKAQLQRQFGARISRQLFDFLLENPEQVHFQGEEREVTCFFSDLAGFTAISERLDSKQTVALLNKYMGAMNEELTKLNAYVNKFLGDGVMAVWGAFATDSRNAERACRAALACMERLDQLNAQSRFEELPKLSMRIGIATGLVTVGDCGAPPELSDYTVIGDSANLAARLESANKQFGTRILVNERTFELAPRELLTRPLGRITVVGQETPDRVFELVAVAGHETEAQRDLVERTTQAVTLFESGELEAARRAWAELVEHHGASKLTDLYLAECDRLLATPDPAFDGVLRLTEK